MQPPTPLLVMWARHSSGEGGPVAETPELGVPCTCGWGSPVTSLHDSVPIYRDSSGQSHRSCEVPLDGRGKGWR